ncbi:hypothetical protein [Longimicrobium sp.]|uniref:hypothetical protein n=1 Tax=Longimicrobium sp. TaxID=2029185 RepID=UPI002BA7D286|nr:hypothetical protein [Longimicrobium sp.]HSU15470.1 hypothetical protein [Longimicrobium sp.]
MRMGLRVAAAAVCAAAVLGACDRGGGGGGDGARKAPADAQEDSSRVTAKALQDSGVSVDTQSIDTGTARTTPAEDN